MPRGGSLAADRRPDSILEINLRERLAAVVADDKARF